MPVREGQAFIFASADREEEPRVRTLKQLVDVLKTSAPVMLDLHLRHGDFSRWIADVFGDYALASEIESLEAQYCIGQVPDINGALAQAIRERYEVTEEADRSW